MFSLNRSILGERMSVFVKLFLTILITFSLLFSFFLNHILESNEKNSINSLKNKISYNSKIYKVNMSQLLYDFNKEIIESTLNSLYTDKDIVKIIFKDHTNTINITLDNKNTKDINAITSEIALVINNEEIGKLHIFYTQEIIHKQIQEYKKETIQFSLALIFLLILILSYFVHMFTKEIKELETAANEIISGNLDYEIKINTSDEIGQLAKKIKIMKNYLRDKIDEIQEQVSFQQSLIDSINIPIYVKDNNFKFLTCNQSFADFIGIDKKDILNKTMKELQNNDFIEVYEKTDKEIFDKKISKNYYTKAFNGKKELRDIISHKNIFINSDKNILSLIGTIVDITELNKAKEKIENLNHNLQNKVNQRTKALELSNEELEDSNEELQTTISYLKETQDKLIESEKMASLGGLVAGVAHEINTPVGIALTGITHLEDLNFDIFKKYQKEEMTQSEFEEYLSTSKELNSLIRKNLNKAASLVRSFKQVAVDQSSEEKRTFNLNKYLHEILESIHSITKKTKIKINIFCDENIKINSYPGAFSQIITNLITNSLIHGFEKNEQGNISIRISKEENKIKLLYKDNGKGIKEENQHKIFDPFFTTNRENGGSGLGLNIIYTLITSKLNGSISCTSTENEGVEFIIIF